MGTKARISGLLPSTPRKRRKAQYLPRLRPRQARAKATFDAIVEATARILEDLGYSALTTNGIAGVAGVAIGAVYGYFPNKESIVAEVVRRTLDAMVRETEEAFANAQGIETKEEAIEKLVRTCMQVLRKRKGLMKVFNQEVPFFWDLDGLKTFPMGPFEIAWRSRAIARPNILEGNQRAMSYLYLLIPIGRWVPYTAIVERPRWLSEEEAEDAAVEIFKRLLT